GLYSVDTDLLVSTFEKRCTKPWPKKFLYVGRYIEEKDLRTLAEGYRIYRSLVKDPWPLSTIGQGPHRKLLEDQIGVDVLDFVQPDDLAVFWERHGAFVIASKYDPWPLVIVEACRAGLPVIHSTACGSAVELVRESYSGYSFPTGSAIGLALAMTKIHHRYDDLRTMGKRSIQLSSPYCSRQWAMNVLEIAWFLEGCKAY
ncbi:MAG: glycosyltransferase, partial [Planctomycetes bacterium]|nr:glycosyltransferase [Planctomycetota bacterium]